MKIYSCPAQVPAPKPDYANYNHAKELQREEEHQAKLKAFLLANGYPGKHTGAIYSEGVADGHALYMLADGPKSCLIHLPYGDGYQSRNAQFVPKSEVIRRIEGEKRFADLLAAKHAEQHATN